MRPRGTHVNLARRRQIREHQNQPGRGARESTFVSMYARMGFVRAPELDFHPLPSVTIKGYRLDFAAR